MVIVPAEAESTLAVPPLPGVRLEQVWLWMNH